MFVGEYENHLLSQVFFFPPRTGLGTALARTMVSDRDGPYHCQYLGNAQSQRIDVIPTPWAMTRALGLGVAQELATLYNIV